MSNNKRIRTKFEEKQLDRMVGVGETGSDFARIWIRSDKPGEILITVNSQEERVTIDDAAADWTQTVVIKGLKPLTRYEYNVVRLSDNELIGKGQFETFPKKPEDTPDKVSIALMSCHQPFSDDNIVSERRMRLLKVLPKILSDHDVKFILLAGDQIYSDIPSDRSLFYKHYTEKWNNPKGPSITDWDAQDVRMAYQERYRIFFSMTEVQHFYANYPCYPILDDHEIVDDWGAKQVHSEKLYQNVKKGALEAYFDYQGSRVTERGAHLPPSFHYSFDYGNVGIFVLDLRSQRKAEDKGDITGIGDIASIGIGDRGGKGKVKDKGQLFDSSQLIDFEKFLSNNQEKRVLLIMSSVPVVHIPEWLVKAGASLTGHALDFPDHWAYKTNVDARDKFLKLIHKHQVKNPKQKVIIVSGDVHIGCAFAIRWEGCGKQPTLYQFTSSAISNRVKKLKTEFLKLVPGWAEDDDIECKNGLKAKTPLLESIDPVNKGENPFGGLNIGIIEIHNEENESLVTFKLVGYPEGKTDEYLDFFVSKKL